MKVRTQTGELVDVSPVWRESSKGKYATSFIDGEGRLYAYNELTFPDDEVTPNVNNEGGVVYIDPTIDYWTRLEHQAAIAAMQGILSMPVYGSNGSEVDQDAVIECAMEYAHALVEKYKKEADR